MAFWGEGRIRGTGGFTLIELMIAVCIIGVLASIALPGYSKFIMTARSAEAPENLSLLYRGAAAYWENSSTTLKGVSATGGGDGAWPSAPRGSSRRRSLPLRRSARGTSPLTRPSGRSDSLRRGPCTSRTRASNVFQGLNCNWPAYPIDPGEPWPYMFWAISDLDGDGTLGGFSLETGVRDGHLVREAGFGPLMDGRGVFGCPSSCVDGVD